MERFGNRIMSRIGRKTIEIPQGVETKIDGQTVLVKGPKGELSRTVLPEIAVSKNDEGISVAPKAQNPSKKAKSYWGLERALIANIIQGVNEGYEKKLEIHGVGFKAAIEENKIVLNIGFSHQVKLEIPEGVTVVVEKMNIIVSGIDKAKVTGFAAKIKKTKPPEPYKGKGIRYEGEVVRRKVGKRAATTAE